MHEVLVNRLGGLSLPRKSVVRLTDRPDMTLDVYNGRKTTKQQSNNKAISIYSDTEKGRHMDACYLDQALIGIFIPIIFKFYAINVR